MLIELRVKYETNEAMQVDQPGWEYFIKLLYVYINMHSLRKVLEMLYILAPNCLKLLKW